MEKIYVEQRDGGYWITGSRVSLDSIIAAFNRGAAPDTIRRSFPILSLEEVYGTITFYLAHQEEIDEYLRRSSAELENEAEARRQQLRSSKPELYERVVRSHEETKTPGQEIIEAPRFQEKSGVYGAEFASTVIGVGSISSKLIQGELDQVDEIAEWKKKKKHGQERQPLSMKEAMSGER